MSKFTVFIIDHIGMGCSSRPQNFDKEIFSPEDAIDYFVNYLEQWRLNISKILPKELKGFYLLGHSFGGYIASNYALKFH